MNIKSLLKKRLQFAVFFNSLTDYFFVYFFMAIILDKNQSQKFIIISDKTILKLVLTVIKKRNYY